mmetsp:Transcript_4715/g.9523  ORF Transcript_4715/g.9523 Transcript_4715/m.9523 type:complete len:330 (-) Transcript_4715:2151-3140(-)
MGLVREFCLEQGKKFGERRFPLALELHDALSATEWCDWVVTNRERLLTEELPRHGAILFRGFFRHPECLSDANSFNAFVEAMGVENFPYVGGNAVRTKVVGERIFTANESPPDRIIPFHHELAQTPSYPSKLLFFCEYPAASGGETPILLSDVVYRELQNKHPDFVGKLEKLGVLYARIMVEHDRAESAIGRGWKSTFNVTNKEDLEIRLRNDGCSWEWLDDNRLRHVSPCLPAIKTLPTTGTKVFFNQIYAAYFGWQDEFNSAESCVTFGDGEPFPKVVMQDLRDIMESNCVAFPWQQGDILLIDNYIAYHARRTFTGRRRVLASLIK